MAYKLFNIVVILFIFQSCINNYKQEELRIYSELTNKKFIYDSTRSDLSGLQIQSIENLQLQFKKDSTFYFVSSNPKLSCVSGRWRLSEFPSIEYWIFKVEGDSFEQWNRFLEVRVIIDSVATTIAFK